MPTNRSGPHISRAFEILAFLKLYDGLVANIISREGVCMTYYMIAFFNFVHFSSAMSDS
jgi:hypothetical protein